MIRKFLPHPVLSVLIVLVWMGLVNRFAWGSLVFAAIIAVLIPLAIRPYWRDVSRIRRFTPLIGFAWVVLIDIVKANIQVAQIVLIMPKAQMRPAWVTVPLTLREPEAITILASAITLTPGTLSCDLSADNRALLVHCLHAPDPQAVVDEIKSRYEARLGKAYE